MTRFKATRGAHRTLVRWLKKQVHCPDAFGSLGQLIRKYKPAAYLDVGCHYGETIARILEENDVRVHGFEPTNTTFEETRKRFRNDSRVTIHNVALSNQTGIAEFQCNVNEQTNSLLAVEDGQEARHGVGLKKAGVQEVQTMTLDDWASVEIPDGQIIIKADIQGAEGLLVAGGETTLSERTIAFYSEAQILPLYRDQTDFFELHRLLGSKLDFALMEVFPSAHDEFGRAWQTDALWINNRFLKS